MAATITSDAGTFSPVLRLTASQAASTRNVLHELIGGGIAVTFGEDSGVTHTLEMVFTSETDSEEAFSQLRAGHLFELTDTDKPTTSMYFVLSGTVERAYQVDSVDTWIITCDIQQVEP